MLQEEPPLPVILGMQEAFYFLSFSVLSGMRGSMALFRSDPSRTHW
jgi:hypothetical protein